MTFCLLLSLYWVLVGWRSEIYHECLYVKYSSLSFRRVSSSIVVVDYRSLSTRRVSSSIVVGDYKGYSFWRVSSSIVVVDYRSLSTRRVSSSIVGVVTGKPILYVLMRVSPSVCCWCRPLPSSLRIRKNWVSSFEM